MTRYAKHALIGRWSASHGTRRISGLDRDEKRQIVNGKSLFVYGAGIPKMGLPETRIVHINGRFYAAMEVKP